MLLKMFSFFVQVIVYLLLVKKLNVWKIKRTESRLNNDYLSQFKLCPRFERYVI